MKTFFKAMSLKACLIAFVLATPAPADENPEIADGERIELEGKEFSIIPPKGWEIHRQIANLSFLFQIPKPKDLSYQRNITVRHGQGSWAMDDLTADHFVEEIVKNRAHLAPGMRNYRFRNRDFIQLADGNKALLFYTQFEFEKLPMMEMHILVSSRTDHFLMTYTDVTANFANDNNGPLLQEAWDAMTSAQVTTVPKARFEFAFNLGVVLLSIGLLFLASRYIAWRRIQSRAREAADDFDTMEPNTESEISLIESGSDLEYMRSDVEEEGEHGSEFPASANGSWHSHSSSHSSSPRKKSKAS